MPRITGIRTLARRDDRFRVEVDGQIVATVDARLIVDNGLNSGVEFDDACRARVETGAARLAAFDKALEALGRRSRASAELHRWLTQRGHAAPHAAAAIERLLELGLLDDASYARSFARARAVGRGMSRRRIRAELRRRGVPREVIDSALRDVLEDEAVDEAALAAMVARKRLRSLAGLELPVRRRRLYAFLARRGYDAELTRRTVALVMAEPD
jgi:regulatory protein